MTTKIEWTETVWNPIVGCSLASPGCTNCYAMRLAGTRLAHTAKYDGLTQDSKAGPVWTGKLFFDEKALLEPLRWKKPRMVFVNSMGDLFHEDVTDEQIDRVFAVMALCPQHTFQVLTKRSARMRDYFSAKTEIRPPFNGSSEYGRARGHVEQWANLTGMKAGIDLPWRPRHASGGYWWGFKADMPWPLPNVWLGVSVEDQLRADERIPDLLATPAAVRWISAEPLLGPVDLTRIQARGGDYKFSAMQGQGHTGAKLDWVVVGGESGKGARPMHPDWARSLRDQCAAADVPFFFKQWGEWHLSLGGPAERPGQFAMMAREPREWSHTNALLIDHYPRQFNAFGSVVLERVGKKQAGRLLDGFEHNGMPS